MTDIHPTAAPPLQPPAALWEDFVDIFYAPSEVFARRANASFVIPLVVLTVVMGILFVSGQRVLEPLYDAEFQRAIAGGRRDGSITPQQVEQMRRLGNTFASVGFIVGFPVITCFLGCVIWIAGKLFDAALNLKAAILIATFSQFPRIIEQLLGLLQGFVLDPNAMDSLYDVSISAARFIDVDTASPLLVATLGRFNLFVLWGAVVVAIGYHVIGRVPKGQAYLAAGLIWAATLIPSLFSAMRQPG